MNQATQLLPISFAALLLSIQSAVCSATTCVKLPSLRPIHRICGVIFFPSRDRIAKAKVTVLQAGKEVAKQETESDGKFSFDQLKEGKYEILVQVKDVPDASTEVVLIRPTENPKREIAVEMMLQGCSNFSLAIPKKLEAWLGPDSSPQD